jgi:16S rRNA processing protein RimM
MLRLGRIVGAHGLKGALRFRPDNPDSETIAKGARLQLELNGSAREYEVAAISNLGRGVRRLELMGLADANAAEPLTGATVLIDEAGLPESKPGEFYYHEVLGCEVFLEDGTNLGLIEEVFSAGANDVWVVRGGGREVLVPVIEDVVKSMDIPARRMTIAAVPGLLE